MTNPLMEAAAKVAELNKQIDEGQEQLGEARSTVARLEQRLPILEDDLSDAEAALALAAKNFGGVPAQPTVEATETAVAEFPAEAEDPGTGGTIEASVAESVEDVEPGTDDAGDVSDGGISLYDANANSRQAEDEPAPAAETVTGEPEAQNNGAGTTFSADALAEGLDGGPFGSVEKPADDEPGVMMQEASEALRASEAMLNELDAEDGEGPAF